MTEKTIDRSVYKTFIYSGEEYRFTVFEEKHIASRQKKVYIGVFASACNPNLPPIIKPDHRYCLKEAQIILPLKERFPQNRNYWDFFPFEGENLRQVIALNDDAVLLTDELKNGSLEVKEINGKSILHCAVIEPEYKAIDIEKFKTIPEKIDLMKQIVCGVKQLLSDKTLKRHRIVAHRDLKFSNVMQQDLEDGTKRFRLIDFPTIKLSAKEDGLVSDYTQLGFFSYSNTAPEDVMSEFKVTEKTDVFALGMMLAEVFGIWDYTQTKNPLNLLFDCVGSLDIFEPIACNKFFSRLNERYRYDGVQLPSWIERSLASHEKNASWREVNNYCPMILEIFRNSTAINPKWRMTLNQFETSLKIAMNQYEERKPAGILPESVEEKVVYCLIDTTNLDAYREIYMNEVKALFERHPEYKVVVIHYGTQHCGEPVTPDPDDPSYNEMNMSEALDYISNLNSTVIEEMHISKLNRYLYDLSKYLENEANRRCFCGKIYIFAPEKPTKNNTCRLKIIEIAADGHPEESYLTGRDIFDASCIRTICVYTFKDDIESEVWYKVKYFDAQKPATEKTEKEPEPTPEKRSFTLEPTTKFNFVGGYRIDIY